MRVLVTGATGFVASHLVPRLVRDGHEVLALGHHRERLPAGLGVVPVEADLSKPIGELPPFDAVVHLAQANVPFPDGALELFRVNVASTAELLEHARRQQAARFVYASSGSVYGLGDDAVGEDDPRRAADYYGATKRSGEALVTAYRDHVGTAILRFFTPYGPGQRGRLIPGLIARVSSGEPVSLRAGGRPRLTPIYIDDAVEAIVRSLETDEHLVVNVGGDEVVSISELADAIGGAVGRQPLFEHGDGDVAGDLIAKNDRLHELLGSRALVRLDEGLRITAAS